MKNLHAQLEAADKEVVRAAEEEQKAIEKMRSTTGDKTDVRKKWEEKRDEWRRAVEKRNEIRKQITEKRP